MFVVAFSQRAGGAGSVFSLLLLLLLLFYGSKKDEKKKKYGAPNNTKILDNDDTSNVLIFHPIHLRTIQRRRPTTPHTLLSIIYQSTTKE